jgi:hypothetical protein
LTGDWEGGGAMGKDSEGDWSLIMAMFAFLALGAFSGYIVGTRVQRQAAVEAGVGRYEVDARTGETRFVYGRSGD